MIKTTFGFFLFFAIHVMFAQEPILIDSVTQLNEVILLDDLNKKEIMGSINSDIIGRSTFENYSPISMVPVLNQSAGVYVLSGALNTNRITIRGIGSRSLFGTDKLRLYYNDIPVTNGTGTSEIEAFDLESLSHIEIVKGPKATSHGANLGGAIILKTREAIGISTNFVNNFTYGSFNLLKNNFSFNHRTDKIQLGLQYGHLETNGYRDNSSFERDGVLLNSTYTINANSKISLLVNHIDYTAQIPSSLGITAYTENPKQAAFTWKEAKGYEKNDYTLVGLSLTHQFNKNLTNTTSFFYNYLDHYEARPFGILDEFTNGYGFRTRFTRDFKMLNSAALYEIGGELLQDQYKWNEFENLYEQNNGNGSLQGEPFAQNKEYRSQISVFASLLLPISTSFSTQIGFNLNKTNYDYKDFFNVGDANKSAERSFDAIVLPNLNLEYRINDADKIYLNISRGYSNPNLEETLTPEGVINPEIKQETGTNYEIGGQVAAFRQKLKLDFAFYRMDVQNLLVAERIDNDRFIGKNAGKTKHQGMELSLRADFDLGTKFKISPFTNYTYNNHSFITFVDNGIDYSGNSLTGVPKHLFQVGLQARIFTDFYWNTTYQHVSGIPLTDANDKFSDAFNLVNMRMGYRKQFNKRFVASLGFGINNIFNTVYSQSVLINTQAFGGQEPRYYYPGEERNYYGSLKVGFIL